MSYIVKKIEKKCTALIGTVTASFLLHESQWNSSFTTRKDSILGVKSLSRGALECGGVWGRVANQCRDLQSTVDMNLNQFNTSRFFHVHIVEKVKQDLHGTAMPIKYAAKIMKNKHKNKQTSDASPVQQSTAVSRTLRWPSAPPLRSRRT